MARPLRCRRIGKQPVYRSFVPEDAEASDTVYLTVDEYEAFRLLDDEGLNQEACAERMNISRTTVTAIYESARHKIAGALVNGKRILITGGRCEYEPVDPPEGLIKKGSRQMRIAVAYEDGKVFQHFGHTEKFKLYDVEDGKIKAEQTVDSDGNGHGALAGFLKAADVDALICGGIGKGAQMALEEEGIDLFGGVQGSADEAAAAYAEGRLVYDPDVRCDHHDHEHHHGGECGSHDCKDHHCGH